jgi:hypothetical protein
MELPVKRFRRHVQIKATFSMILRDIVSIEFSHVEIYFHCDNIKAKQIAPGGLISVPFALLTINFRSTP